MTAVFWIDHEHDQEAASDGVSRYGAYVRQRQRAFAECWDGCFESRLAERFAALAWESAASPVMAPPYATWGPPVLSARIWVDSDGDSPGLIAAVTVASGWPAALGRGQVGGRCWRPWPSRHSFTTGTDYPRDPDGDEVAKGGYYALASVRLVFPIPASLLPAPPGPRHERGEVEETARDAVDAVVDELNRVTGPVVGAVERS